MSDARARRGKRQSDLVITKRISAIYDLYVQGLRKPEIMRKIAAQQVKEAEQRRVATSDKKTLPPFVWGEDKLPMRTFEFYMMRAKERVMADGKKLVTPGYGDVIVAKNFARQDAIYAAAFEVGRFEVCRKIIVDQLTLCSLMGKIVVSISALDQQPTTEGEVAPIGQAERSLPEIADEQIALLNQARQRMGLPPLPGARNLKLVAGNGGV